MRDLALIGLFFCMAPILSMLPFAGYVVPVLFPVWIILLSFRRAVLLAIICGVVGIVTSAFSLGLLSFILTGTVFICLFPGQVLGIWFFKKLVNESVPLALFLYRFFLIVVGAIVMTVGMYVVILYGSQFLKVLMGSVMLPFDVSTITVPITVLRIIGTIGVGGILGLTVGIPVFLLLVFVLECRLLKSINKRVKGLPIILK